MKTLDFSEILPVPVHCFSITFIAASDLKVGGSRHLVELMKVCEY